MQKYRNPFFFSLFLFYSLLQLGCASTFLNTYHISEYAPKALSTSSLKKKVVSERSQFVFMWFNFNNDYVDKAFYELQKKCPGQRISGIHTRYSTKTHFFFWTNKVIMRGYCHS